MASKKRRLLTFSKPVCYYKNDNFILFVLILLLSCDVMA